MNLVKAMAVCGLALLLAGGLQACGRDTGGTHTAHNTAAAATKATPAAQLRIIEWGPQPIKAGVVFNKQPSGSAAIWVRMNQSLVGYTATVDFNGTSLDTAISSNLVTALIPAKLYAKPGAYTLRVVARRNGESFQSNKETFRVK